MWSVTKAYLWSLMWKRVESSLLSQSYRNGDSAAPTKKLPLALGQMPEVPQLLSSTGSFPGTQVLVFVSAGLILKDLSPGFGGFLLKKANFLTPGVGDGQRGLACCSPRGRKESDTTERLNCTELNLLTL